MKSRTILLALTLTAVAGGSATAGSLITGAQIKNGSITGVDIRAHSLTQRQFKGKLTGPPGATGPQGTAGPQGPQGPQGPAGAAASTSVQRIAGADTVIANGSSGTATATCPSGTQLTGGGFVGTSNVQVTHMDGAQGVWSVGIKNTGGGQSVTDAVAFCIG